MGRKPTRSTRSERAPADERRVVKAVLIKVNDEGWRALRHLAIEKSTTLQALGIEALNDLLEKNGIHRSARNPFEQTNGE
jgi:hypothetical protein